MKNKYEIRGEVTAIILNSPKYGRMEALISTSKLERVKEMPNNWYPDFQAHTQSFYVMGAIYIKGKPEVYGLHRWIINARVGMVVDHIDHDTLNNIDSNLREITSAENLQNRKGAMKNTKSGIRGVTWNERRKKWLSRIFIEKKGIFLGYFDDINEAERVAKEAREKYMPYSQEALAN